MACNDKDRCASPVSSSCVTYIGTKLTSVSTSAAEEKLKCGVTATDVVQTIDAEVKLIQDSLSSKTLQVKCFTTVNRDKVKQFELNQLFIDELCLLKKNVSSSSVNYNDIVANVILPITCGLTNCDGTNTKKLVELMQMFCTEIESLKMQINQLRSQGNTNSNLYIPNT